MNQAMAETVKKSRIVSETDDNLEESLMEEFNHRLKSCMSQEPASPEQQQPPGDIYETVDELKPKTNGHHEQQPEEDEDEESDVETFLQMERECHYDVPRDLLHGTRTNEKTDSNNTADQYVEMHSPKVEDTEEAIYENVKETSNVYEEIPDLISEVERKQEFRLNFSELEDGNSKDEVQSAKNRMLLSTDDAACLLFTQTVVSPMLTPSEENIDFLKGFKEPETPVSNSESDGKQNSDESNENIYENAEFLNQPSEKLYENVEMLKNGDIQETQNLPNEHIYANLQKIEDLSFDGIKPGKDATDGDGDDGTRLVKSLTTQFLKSAEEDEDARVARWEHSELSELKTLNIMKQISKFENREQQSNVTNVVSTQTFQSSSYVETTTKQETAVTEQDKGSLKKKKSKKSRKEHEKENISVKSSFNKFDALQKKNLLHVRSSDSSKAQEKFSGSHIEDANCKSCSKQVFQMEQIKAEKAIWHKNCFRCHECNKQLNVDTYESHEGTLYCKPHFKALFAPKVVEEDTPPPKNRHKLIICENQPVELPPDVVRASDKPDLGLEELQSLNVKQRFQVFEHHQESEENQLERTPSAVNVKRSPSILSKLARFQAKGMDIGVSDEALNGIPIEESSSEEEEEVDDGIEGEDADLIRAKRVQKEKPFHFTGMSDVKSKWEQGEQNTKEKRREERKQEIQNIRNQLFMGKQGKMKELYQQAVMEAESGTAVKKAVDLEIHDTRSIKEKFEKGEVASGEEHKEKEQEDLSVIESGISKKSRSIFLELDANAAKNPPSISSPTRISQDVKKTREVFMSRQQSEDVVKSSEQVDDVTIRTADIQQRFKFFETYREPEKQRKEFRITPPREGQVKAPTPDREVYRDPEVVRAEEYVEDSVVAKQSHTATKMLNKFRQMEESMSKEPIPAGPKPLKCFTPPPEPPRQESSSGEDSGSEEESEASEEVANQKVPDEDLLEAQKAARAKQLRAKFERWEANEIKREQNNSSVNIAEEIGEDQSQIESTRSLRARFESMRETTEQVNKQPRVKVHRFVDYSKKSADTDCDSCHVRVYQLEKVSVHGLTFHRQCFKCSECGTILRMESYSYNQGLLYCLPHFKRLFISKGNYDTGFGFDSHKEKWNATYI